MRKSIGEAVSLTQNNQFRKLYQKGASQVCPSVVVYVRRNGLKHNRLGITVSKKIGKATIRNRAKRRLREVYRTNSEALQKGFDFVLVARGRTASTPYQKLNADFLHLADKLGVMKND